MFKLFLFAAFLAFAAALPAPIPAPLPAPLPGQILPYTNLAGLPVVSNLGTPITYQASYPSSLTYSSYAAPYGYLPYAYKSGYII